MFLLQSLSFPPRFLPIISTCSKRVISTLRYRSAPMDVKASLVLEGRKRATHRLYKVSNFTTELLEIRSEHPSLHVLFIPGNPGVVSFYEDFLESTYELLEGNASITAIGHISHSRKDWEGGKLFSLQDQIDHKVEFIEQEFQNKETPILLIGHSIGAYIAVETFKRIPKQVKYTIGLYPFLTMNEKSLVQSMLVIMTVSKILMAVVSFIIAFLGLFPIWFIRFLVRNIIGKSWTATAVEAATSHLLQYHTIRNILYMGKTEFEKLSKDPDWTFIRKKQSQLAFLFGIDDHWGPLTLYQEISKQAPDLSLTIEREGHTHSFSCTKAGSTWAAHYVVSLIKNQDFKMISVMDENAITFS